jgi:hypothetical protein
LKSYLMAKEDDGSPREHEPLVDPAAVATEA